MTRCSLWKVTRYHGNAWSRRSKQGMARKEQEVCSCISKREKPLQKKAAEARARPADHASPAAAERAEVTGAARPKLTVSVRRCRVMALAASFQGHKSEEKRQFLFLWGIKLKDFSKSEPRKVLLIRSLRKKSQKQSEFCLRYNKS